MKNTLQTEEQMIAHRAAMASSAWTWVIAGVGIPGPEPGLGDSGNLRKSHGEKRSGIRDLQKSQSEQIQRI